MNIALWVKEYEKDQGLHEHRVRYSKYTDTEKQTVIEYYYTHGQNGLQTVKALGYPSRSLLSQWVEENPRETEKDCKKRKTPVRCSEEQREQHPAGIWHYRRYDLGRDDARYPEREIHHAGQHLVQGLRSPVVRLLPCTGGDPICKKGLPRSRASIENAVRKDFLVFTCVN